MYLQCVKVITHETLDLIEKCVFVSVCGMGVRGG